MQNIVWKTSPAKEETSDISGQHFFLNLYEKQFLYQNLVYLLVLTLCFPGNFFGLFGLSFLSFYSKYLKEAQFLKYFGLILNF